jgi:hypothetical protein
MIQSPTIPQNIIDKIAFYLPYKKAIRISPILKKKLGARLEVDENSWNVFARNGNIFGLDWLHFHYIKTYTNNAMNFADGEGHLDVIKWLLVNRSEDCTVDDMDAAVKNSHLDVVKSKLHIFLNLFSTDIASGRALLLILDPKVILPMTTFMLSLLVFYTISFTDIDYTTYLSQSSLFLQGQRNYTLLYGSSGPLVYPALHLYLYSTISMFSLNLAVVQLGFCFLYGLLVLVLVLIYEEVGCNAKHSCDTSVQTTSLVDATPGYVANLAWLLIPAIFSKRIMSIHVLRCFNDPFGVLLMALCILVLLWDCRTVDVVDSHNSLPKDGGTNPGRKKKISKNYLLISAILFSLSLGVKMNTLLYVPAIVLIYWRRCAAPSCDQLQRDHTKYNNEHSHDHSAAHHRRRIWKGLWKGIGYALVVLLVQLILSWPFLYADLERWNSGNRVRELDIVDIGTRNNYNEIDDAAKPTVTSDITGGSFLWTYTKTAFNLSREFDYHWTVNWKFVPRFIFDRAVVVGRAEDVNSPTGGSDVGIRLSRDRFTILDGAELVEGKWKYVCLFFYFVLCGGVVYKWICKFGIVGEEVVEVLDSGSRVIGSKKKKQVKRKKGRKPEGDKPEKREAPRKQTKPNPTSRDILHLFFLVHFIGIITARSLHFQFYVWYWYQIGFLLWCGGCKGYSCGIGRVSGRGWTIGLRTTIPPPSIMLTKKHTQHITLFISDYYIYVGTGYISLFLQFVIELCWNKSPPAAGSSAVLFVCHLCVLCFGMKNFCE